MITRYNANFVDHMMEPSDEGRWVKYAEHEQSELLVDIKVEEQVAEKLKAERAELEALRSEVKALTEVNGQIDSQLREMSQNTGTIINRQLSLIHSAKDRLNLHGHSPICDSRYKMTSSDGNTINGECNCGLDLWMIESGVKHG